MNRCKLCVTPDTRPDTQFIDGVCSACIAYAKRENVDWATRKKNLEGLLDQYGGGEYDCIVPSSGGKDSHYQVLTLLDMGAKPLVVTATTCHLTPIGRRNIDNLARHADTLEITPNRTVRAKLNRLAMEMVGDISWPEHVLIHTVPFKVAIDMGIPLVFYGENPLNQYGGPSAGRQAEKQMTRQWVSEFGGFLGMRAADFIGVDGITERAMRPYAPMMSSADLDNIGVYFLGQFIPWDSHRNAERAKEAGMEQTRPSFANIWPHENLDNAQTGIHDHVMFLKYGYGRGCAQAAVDVRSGRTSRETALNWVERFDGELEHCYGGVLLDEVLACIDLTMAQFRKILADYKREAT
jgi:N-acetyl sugar amidotransferase